MKKQATVGAGKPADIAVLNRGYLSVQDEEIKDTQVDLTIVGGDVVWDREPAEKTRGNELTRSAMLEAKVEGQLVQAGPDSPEKAQCPSCPWSFGPWTKGGSTVTKRKRRRMDGSISYFYRHVRGEGMNCPPRYSGLRR
jgi:hypothetical protein